MERAELTALVRGTGCARERDGVVFLVDPRWGAAERSQLEAAVGEDSAEAAELGWLCVPTGGTSGTVKFARHDERTMSAAVRGFCGHFGLTRVNAVDVLPPFHVSGLMARVRCAMTGGMHVGWDWRRLEAGERPELAAAEDGWVISLVPTQLQRLLGDAAGRAWLRRFRVIFVGGGPTWPELTDAAAQARLPLSLGYGMTETAAMVAALTPEEFMAGERSAGRAMPHARIALGADGRIGIEGESVFRGYWPEARTARRFETADLGEINARGFLQVLGRADAVIISGGEKVQPAEVEVALRATGEFEDVAVIGVPDREWGESIVACYPADARPPRLERVEALLREWLGGFKRPKRYIAVNDWPRNAQGKLNRAELRRRVAGPS